MAKLYFYYSAMNAGKTTTLIQSAFNYRERGMNVLCFLPEIVTESFHKKIQSRIGLQEDPILLGKNMNVAEYVRKQQKDKKISCVFVDEAQFLNKEQIAQLCTLVDEDNIPVLTYGLRTDFKGNLFEGSQYLLGWADELVEVKTICDCGRKAIMTARVNHDGIAEKSGSQIECAGNDRYISYCRKHYSQCLENSQKKEKKS